MDEQAEHSAAEPTHSAAAQTTAAQTTRVTPEKHVEPTTQAAPEREHKQAYGTAKTENLRDSGLWRILLPVAVVVFCAALVIIPLGILIPILLHSISVINTGAPEGHLIWLWVGLIIIEMGLVYIIVRGIFRIFLTQAGNYQHVR
jgi:hypothetical protein